MASAASRGRPGQLRRGGCPRRPVVNATSGAGSLDALRQAGGANLEGKVLVDVANPLDFSRGMPPTFSVANTDSLGEQIQRAFPGVRVVKSLSTITAALMVDPGQVAGGDHHVFVSGDDPDAKAQVMRLLTDGFGWRQVIDLGDITSARAAEMYVASGSACSAPSAPHGQPQGGHLRVRGAGAARPG
jgi:8-hydroxy-5-deazaflavin:NADPH oxidoreductase